MFRKGERLRNQADLAAIDRPTLNEIDGLILITQLKLIYKKTAEENWSHPPLFPDLRAQAILYHLVAAYVYSEYRINVLVLSLFNRLFGLFIVELLNIQSVH